MEEMPVTQARAEFAELVNRVAYSGESIVLTRHGRPLAAVVPAGDVAPRDLTSRVEVASGPTKRQSPPASSSSRTRKRAR